MALIDDIRRKFIRRYYELTKHAVDQSIVRSISVTELEEAIKYQSEVIEDYPQDKYGPSCLILGFTKANRALHVQCSYPDRPIVKVITLYEPDPAIWIDCKIRKARKL